jgi:peptidoglycan/LPS O-acetylase OafA/YrhL
MYIPKLTSLRGVACLVVLVGHCSDMFDASTDFSDVIGHFGAGGFWSTVHQVVLIAFNGQAAVNLFFVISGCVLYLQFQKIEISEEHPTFEFFRRRAFRIYPAAIVSVLFAYLIFYQILPLRSMLSVPTMSLDYLDQTIDIYGVMKNFLVISNLIDPPHWSLKVELELSAIFPVLYLLSSRPWLFIAVGFVVAGMMFDDALGHTPLRESVLSFILGCALPRFQSIGRSIGRFEAPVAILALLALMLPRRFLQPLEVNPGLYFLPEALASFVLARCVVYRTLTLRFLDWRPMILIGDWSYSIYVFHYPVMWGLVALLSSAAVSQLTTQYPIASGFVLAVATLAATLPIAGLSYRFIERPFIHLGRHRVLRPSTT